MENSIYLGLSRQMVLQTNMDITANNVANMNTPGYRGQNMVFKEFLSDPRGADDALSFVYDEKQYEITDPGPVRITGNPLDVALVGPGFMGVQGPGGQTVYSRAGDFTMGANGELLTASGFPVATNGGGGITIPAGSTEIKIDKKGVISNQDGQIGQIMVVEFANTQELEPLGNNLYSADAAGQAAQNTTVNQGHLEGSNVNSIMEVSNMIKTLRDFQSTQNVLQTENERLRTAIQKLTRQN